jgi:hypothetical protein
VDAACAHGSGAGGRRWAEEYGATVRDRAFGSKRRLGRPVKLKAGSISPREATTALTRKVAATKPRFRVSTRASWGTRSSNRRPSWTTATRTSPYPAHRRSLLDLASRVDATAPGRWRRAPSPGSSSSSPTVLAPALPPAAHSPAHRSASNCQVRSSILPFQTGPAAPASRRPECRRARLIQDLVEGGTGGRRAAGGLVNTR